MSERSEVQPKKKFDLKVHHMDPKKMNRVLKVTHYEMHVGPYGKRFVRAGREFYASGEEVPLMECQYARQEEKRQAIAEQDKTRQEARETAKKAEAEARAEAEAKAKAEAEARTQREHEKKLQAARDSGQLVEPAKDTAPAPQADEPAAPAKEKPAKSK